MSDPNAPQPENTPIPPAGPGPAVPPSPAQPAAPVPPPAAQQPPAPPAYGAAPPAPGGYAAAPAAPLTAEQDKTAAMWAHIGGVIGFLPSLIIWLVFKDRGPRTNVEAKEALNWQITFTIGYVALWIVVTILSGVFIAAGAWAITPLLNLLPLALWVVNVIFSIMGGLKVNGGGSYRYPVNFRFIK